MFIHIMILIKHMQDYRSNYNKFPATTIKDGVLISDWNNILDEIVSKTNNNIICIECYSGTHKEELVSNLYKIPNVLFVNSDDYFKSAIVSLNMTQKLMRDDVPLGWLRSLTIEDYLDDAR